MSTIKAVLFDLDGTLVNSLPEIYFGIAEVCRRKNLPIPTEEAVTSMVGKGARTLVKRVLRHIDVGDDVITEAEFFTAVVECWGETKGAKIEFFPGVLDGLRELKAAGIKVALVTNKIRSLTVDFVEERGIADLFDTIVAGDDCPTCKPDPEMLELALRNLDVAPEEAVMVGDSRNDALAARAAGVAEALVECGYNEGISIVEWAKAEGFSRLYPTTQDVCRLIATRCFG